MIAYSQINVKNSPRFDNNLFCFLFLLIHCFGIVSHGLSHSRGIMGLRRVCEISVSTGSCSSGPGSVAGFSRESSSTSGLQKGPGDSFGTRRPLPSLSIAFRSPRNIHHFQTSPSISFPFHNPQHAGVQNRLWSTVLVNFFAGGTPFKGQNNKVRHKHLHRSTITNRWVQEVPALVLGWAQEMNQGSASRRHDKLLSLLLSSSLQCNKPHWYTRSFVSYIILF